MGIFNWEPLSAEEEKRVMSAIANAELNTSGEIRVHIDKWCKSDPLFKAKNLFMHLKMDATKNRNGVLIYVAIKEHKFAIVGDEGIDKLVPDDFWDGAKKLMHNRLAQGNVVSGICDVVEEAGKQLKKYFPYQSDDENELPNEISYG